MSISKQILTFAVVGTALYSLVISDSYAEINVFARSLQPPVECRGAPAITEEQGLLNPPSGSSIVRVVKPIELASAIMIDVDLCFAKKGRLDIGDGITVQVNGNIYAGPWHIFDYQGEDSGLIAPRINVIYPEWWGAKANDQLNDSAALRYASLFLSDMGGGRIEFSRGSYIVGEQYQLTDNLFPLRQMPILDVRGTNSLVEINGNGAKLVAESGLYFGYFDPVSGLPAVPGACGASSPNAANAYTMINLEHNTNVVVRDFELDGNIDGLELGAACPDGRQLFGYGIRAYNNEAVQIENIYAHHNALDGIMIGYAGLTEGEPEKPHTISNVISEYNARGGISWVGGNSLVIDGCKSNHTGKGRFSSPPGAGIDIEAESAVIRNGLITNCEFINNNGPGVVSDSGDGGYTTITNSTIWGTTNWALVAHNPGLVFEDSYIYGAVPNPYGVPNGEGIITDPNLATRFTRIHFEDLEYGDLGVYRGGGALLQLEGNNIVIEDSEVIANGMRAFWLDGAFTREIVRNVTVTHGDDSRTIGDFQSIFRGSHLENVRFKESFSNPPTTDPSNAQGWYISAHPASNVTYIDVCVDGPWVRWNHSYPVEGSIGCGVLYDPTQ